MSTNVVVITGNLGHTPVVRESKNGSGTHFCFFSIANNERFRTASGEMVQHTNWIRVAAFGPLADTLVHLEKGDRVTVVGRLRTSSRIEKDKTRRTETEVLAQRIDFLDYKGKAVGEAEEAPEGSASDEPGLDESGEEEDDLQF